MILPKPLAPVLLYICGISWRVDVEVEQGEASDEGVDSISSSSNFMSTSMTRLECKPWVSKKGVSCPDSSVFLWSGEAAILFGEAVVRTITFLVTNP